MVNPAPGTVEEGMAKLLASEPEEPTDEEVQVTEPEEIPEEVTPVVEGDGVEEVEEPEGQPEVTYDVNGEQLGVEELRLGYMRDADYRKKTMALAEKNKADEVIREAFNQNIEQAELVAILDQEDLASPESLELKEFDPTAYYEKRDKIEAKQKRLESLRVEKRKLAEARESERIAQEQELLGIAIPEWVDTEKALEEIQLCRGVWNEMNFTPEELQGVGHKLVVLTRKAALYDRITAAKPEDKKVTTKPKTATPGTVTTSDDKSRAKRKGAKERFDKSGKLDDAVRLLLE